MGTKTDEQGSFVLQNLEAGSYTLLFSYLGYDQQKRENLILSDNQRLDLGRIEMSESGLTLREITISPGSFSVMGTLPLSRQTFTEKDIKADTALTSLKVRGPRIHEARK